MSASPPRHAFEQAILDAWPAAGDGDEIVLVGTSGGADSTALLRAIRRLHPAADHRIVATYVHHGLRPEADDELRFVATLAQDLNLRFEAGRVHIDPQAAGDGLEAAARSARYGWFEHLAGRLGARWVAVAHTADDQAETILHHILRGTSLAGLAGMPFARDLGPAALVRPCLQLTRADVLEYLASLGQPYLHDASNLDTRLTRNALRHELLPWIEQRIQPAVRQHLLRLGQLASEAHQTLADQAEALADQIAQRTPEGWHVDCRRLADTRPYLVRELCVTLWRRADWPRQSMGYAQWQRLAELMRPDQALPAIMLPGAVRAQRQGPLLHLARPSDSPHHP